MTAKRKTQKDSELYQLKVTLQGIRPPIWRRIQVPGFITLNQLHEILQEAMGWENYHLHLFEIGRDRYTAPAMDEDWDDVGEEDEDDTQYTLDEVVTRPGQRFRYTYDFGDGWDHAIVVEEILPAEKDVKYPVCLAGKRACPPEDCGGPWGYQDLLEALGNPKHERHEELSELVGGKFDPEDFKLEKVNEHLKSVRPSARRRKPAH